MTRPRRPQRSPDDRTTRSSSGRPDRGSARAVEITRRAIEVGSLGEAAPIAFMKWARSIGVEFHPDWWDAVVGEEALAKDEAEAPQRLRPVRKLRRGSRNRFSRWSPDGDGATAGTGRAPKRATAEIASDLEGRRLADPDTIRKWLRKGASSSTESDDCRMSRPNSPSDVADVVATAPTHARRRSMPHVSHPARHGLPSPRRSTSWRPDPRLEIDLVGGRQVRLLPEARQARPRITAWRVEDIRALIAAV